MNKFNEIKYIHQLGLESLKQCVGGYVCKCPSCGINTSKRKLYILTEKKQFITVFCQKCGINTNLKNFIRTRSTHLFEEYTREERQELLTNLQDGTLFKKDNFKSEINNEITLQYKFKFNHKYFIPATKSREAVEYCKRRQINSTKLYYNVHPKHILSGMLIFPFYLEDGETLYGFQGRHTKEKKFHTHSKNESMKVYNIYNVDLNLPVYIFESIIDSMMVENGIAMLGTTLSKAIYAMMKNPIHILDNDYVGLMRCKTYLEEGKKCLIYPDSFKFKDFNAAVCGGINKSTLPRFIKENTYQGLEGITKIKLQLMKRKK